MGSVGHGCDLRTEQTEVGFQPRHDQLPKLFQTPAPRSRSGVLISPGHFHHSQARVNPWQTRVVVLDLDDDGELDVITGFINAVSYLSGNRDGTFDEAIIFDFNCCTPGSAALGDLDDDEDLDVVLSILSLGWVRVLLNTPPCPADLNDDGSVVQPTS